MMDMTVIRNVNDEVLRILVSRLRSDMTLQVVAEVVDVAEVVAAVVSVVVDEAVAGVVAAAEAVVEAAADVVEAADDRFARNNLIAKGMIYSYHQPEFLCC